MNREFFLAVGICAVSLSVPVAALAVTVGPVRLEYSANPGDTVSGQMFLQNEQAETQTYYPSFQRFTEENGSKVFSAEDIGLSSWIHSTSAVTLAPGEKTYVPFDIAIPKDAPPGGHFAVIWWSTTPPNQGSGGQLAVVSRAGILVYLQVAGDIREAAFVKQLSTSQALFFNPVPIDVDLSIRNDGNSYIKPTGNVVLQNMFGLTQASAVINSFGSNILPRSERDFKSTLTPPAFVFGPYRIVAHLVYGANNTKEMTQTVWVWIFPWSLLIWAAIFLALVLFVVPRSIRRYNRWIIEKAKVS